MIRFAIDENVPTIIQEGLRAIYHLIGSDIEEQCLEVSEACYTGDIYPGVPSETHSKEKVISTNIFNVCSKCNFYQSRKELDEEENELRDVEVLQLDVIRALVRMDLLVRLR